MLSKNKIKFIQSLSRKKVRDEEQMFLVEGNKMVLEAIDSNFAVELVCATTDFIESKLSDRRLSCELVECNESELSKASQLKNPQQALAVVKMHDWQLNLEKSKSELILALDFIQDPGNLGTIIRLADWFGIKTIICSENTVDCFNPKVIQASMGAIFRTSLYYTNLADALKKAPSQNVPIYGTFMEGENIYQSDLSSNGIIVLGNEGNGISPEIEELVNQKIHIPSFAGVGAGSESLNVAMATAICCSEFRRKSIR